MEEMNTYEERPDEMLLAFDVGNTNIVLGAFKGKVAAILEIRNDESKSADEYGCCCINFFNMKD